MPSPRIYTYVQNNFFVGERKTSLSFDKGTTSSVQELLNYRVLKSGAIRRRPGTREEFEIDSRIDPESEILKLLEFSKGYVVLTRLEEVVKLYYISSVKAFIELTPSPYVAVSYSLLSGSLVPDTISLGSYTDVLAMYDRRPLDIIDIEELGKSIFILFKTGLPYRLFEEDNILYIAPYYYKTDIGTGYDDFIRSLPISNIQTSFNDVFYANGTSVISADSSTLVIRDENLDVGTCKAYLSVDRSHDVDSTRVDTAKMALQDYLFKPIIFNVFPTNPEVISFDVGSVYKMSEDDNGVPSVELSYLADWDLETAYRSTLLSNLNDACRIQSFSYNPVINSAAAAAIGNSSEIVGSKAQLIRELLYGRKYMIIPYEVVGGQAGRIKYHTALPTATVVSEAVTATEVTTEVIASGLVRQNEDTFSTITIRNYTLESSSSPDVLIKGTITRPIAGFGAITAAASYNRLRVAFPQEYTLLIGGERGTRFNQLPWGSVVLGDWLSFHGVSMNRGTLGEGDNEIFNRNVVVTLHAGTLVDSSKVFEGVTSILVYKAGVVVDDNTGPSGDVAVFTANPRTVLDSVASRDFAFSGGGTSIRHFPDTETTEPDDFLSYRRTYETPVVDRLIQNSYSPSLDRDNQVAYVGSALGTVANVFEFESGSQPRFTNFYPLSYRSYGFDRPVNIYGVIPVPLIEGHAGRDLVRSFFVIYKGDGDIPNPSDDDPPRYGWASTYSGSAYNPNNIGLNVLPGNITGVGPFNQQLRGTPPLTPLSVNSNYDFVQGLYVPTINGRRLIGSVKLLFKVDRRGTEYVIYSARQETRRRHDITRYYINTVNEGNTINWDISSLGGPLVGFFIDNQGTLTLTSDSATVTVAGFGSSGTRTFSFDGDSPGVLFTKDISIFRNIIHVEKNNTRRITSIGDDGINTANINTCETYTGTTTVVTPTPSQEISILKDFFNPERINEGAASLNITLIKPPRNRGFQGFDVIPYNIRTDTAFGFNLINNNEYVFDNRHATGSFDFPVLDTGGSANINLGSVVAFGRHFINTELGSFYTWFLHITKGGALSNYDILYMRIGGSIGRTYTLYKQSIASLEGNVEVYIQDVDDFISERDNSLPIPSPVTLELFSGRGNTDPHIFAASEINERVSNVYANCLIFEIGMPSTARDGGGVRVIGGNNYDLGFTRTKVAYSSDDYNYAAFASFRNNFTLIRDDSVSYFYQNENKANRFTRILNNENSDELKDLFIKANYIPGSFNQQFVSVIPLYLLSIISRASYVITDSPQVLTFDNYINKTGNRSQVDYLKRVVNPRGRSVNLTSAVSSFDGEGIFVASEEGLYNVPSAVGGVASLVHNQRFKLKPLVFHNRFVFISPDDLMITQVRSRERLGLKSNYSGADQISLLGSVTDIVFNQDNQVYMMPDSSGDIVVATDFDTDVAGFAKWSFGDTNTKCLKLLTASDGVKGIFRRGERGLVLVSFDESITEDFKEGTDDNTGERFTSRAVSNALVSADTTDTGLYRGHIKKIHIDYNLCSQIKVGFVADNTISVEYDYVKQDSQGVDLPYNQPLDSGGGVIGYNPRVTLSQDGLTDCNGIIYGFRFTGVLDGF